MTYLQIVNKILVGLRQPTVASLAADYSILISQFVNAAKADIEDMGPWRALRTTIAKNTVAATSTISLTTETSERSYPLVKDNVPLVYLTTSGKERMLEVVPVEEIQRNQLLVPTAANDIPYLVAFAKSNGGLTAHFWPTPDAIYAIKFVMVVPEDDFDPSTGAALTPAIPADPIWREALVRAMEERGEEFAGSLDGPRARAQNSLAQALLNDFGAEPLTFEAV